MTDTTVSIVVVLIGAAVLICRHRLARLVVETQNQAWGFRFGTREERVSRFVLVTVGAAFLIVETLALLCVIHWKARSKAGVFSRDASSVSPPPNRPLERSGVNALADIAGASAGRSAPRR